MNENTYTEKLLDRIMFDKDILVGKPIIRGMRISVDMILDLLAKGSTRQEILEDYNEQTCSELSNIGLKPHADTENLLKTGSDDTLEFLLNRSLACFLCQTQNSFCGCVISEQLQLVADDLQAALLYAHRLVAGDTILERVMAQMKFLEPHDEDPADP